MENSGFRLVSSVRGKIEWLLFFCKGDDEQPFGSFLVQMLKTLPERMQFLVVCQKKEHLDALVLLLSVLPRHPRFTFFKLAAGQFDSLGSERCWLLVAPQNLSGLEYPWSRDYLMVWTNTDASAVQFWDATQLACKNSLSQFLTNFSLGSIQTQVGYNFQRFRLLGGNVLSDEDFVFVDFKDFERSWTQRRGRAFNLESEAVLEFEKISGRRVILVGKNAPIPVEMVGGEEKVVASFRHIDQWLSLTGCRPDMFSTKYVVLVARCIGTITRDGLDCKKYEKKIKGYNLFLDKVAVQLETEHGFKVLRNPVPLIENYVFQRDGSYTPFSTNLGMLNNVLVEVSTKKKRVFLPSIRGSTFFEKADPELRKLESDNKVLWKSLGFKATIVKANFHPFMYSLGALHCLTNDFIRTP